MAGVTHQQESGGEHLRLRSLAHVLSCGRLTQCWRGPHTLELVQTSRTLNTLDHDYPQLTLQYSRVTG